MSVILKPRAHQADFLDFHARRNPHQGSLAWHSMGLGKTLSALWDARRHLGQLNQMGIKDAYFLVIVPKSAMATWRKECFKNTPDLMTRMVIYPYSQLHNAIKTIKHRNIRMIIFDESHALKSQETNRNDLLADFLLEIHRINGFDKGRIILSSGTPAPNGAHEFYTSWAICASPNLVVAAEWLKDKKRYENWKMTFATKKEVNWKIGKGRPKEKQRSGHATKWEGVENEAMLQQLLSPFVHFKRVEDCIDLPEKQEIHVDLALPDDKLLEDANIEEPDAYMAKVERLARAKTPHMLEWVKDFVSNTSDQLVVFAMNRHPLDELIAAFPDKVRLITGGVSGAERAANELAFQNGEFQVIGMTYKAGSEALNFQNCRYSLYHGWPWTDATVKQAIARTYRSGQKNKSFHYFLTSGENDSKVLRDLRNKEEATTRIQNLLLQANENIKPLKLDDLI